MDVSMLIMNGIEVICLIKEEVFYIKVLMLIMYDNCEYIM